MLVDGLFYRMLKKHLLIALGLSATLIGHSQVTLRDSVLTWKHFRYELDDEYHIISWDDEEVVADEYTAHVIENDYIKLTLVPEFGGRILSFIYKPTGHEQLYQNPIGAPYGMNEGNFYYNWLMVWGGIFPTFPEPEHGKSWLLPWTYEVAHINADSVVIRMALKDTLSYSNKPSRFNNGETGITCVATVTVRAGSSAFDLSIDLINDQATSKKMEYWTCNTFSPGSEPGNTFSPLSSEMVVPIDRYQPRWSPGNWLISNPIDEKSGASNDILKYENLRFLENWRNMGIAYAYPGMTADFYGVINHENEEGIFRVGDNTITSGLKFWTWGSGAITNDPMDFYDNKRSYIELWSGLSYEFFADAEIPANTTISWTETFFPSFDMKGVTYANRKAYVFLDVEETGLLNLFINTVIPDTEVEYRLIAQRSGEVLAEGTAISGAESSFHVSADLSSLNTGLLAYELTLEGTKGLLLSYAGELEVPNSPLSARQAHLPFAINRTGQLNYELVVERDVEFVIYDLNGRIHAGPFSTNSVIAFSVADRGLYLARVSTTKGDFVVKFIAM